MNSDNYEFAKSSRAQGVDEYSPYTAKSFNYIPDINSGVYGTSMTQVQFDLSSLFMSSGFVDVSDLFLTIPIVTVAQLSTANGVAVAPGNTGYSVCSLKSNYQHLVHQIEIVADGKVLNDTQPLASLYSNFKLLSQMSPADLASFGETMGFSKCLDNPLSLAMSQVAGVGLMNNHPMGSLAVPASDIPVVPSSLGQNGGTVNTAITRRISRLVDSTTGASKIYGTNSATAPVIMTGTQLGYEYRPYYVISGTTMVWYDVAVLPLKYLCDCIDKIGLCRKFNAVMRLYLNTGTISVPITGANSTGATTGIQFGSTFQNTCPITINIIPDATANGGNMPATVTFVTAGVYVAKVPTTSIALSGAATAVNLASGVSNHFMLSCRAYYSAVQLEPSRALAYVESNRSKLCVYENFITNQYNAIPASGSFSQLVQSGIRNPLAVVIMPFVSSSALTIGAGAIPNPAGTFSFSQWASCVDTCPATYSPCSLINLQVQLGGQNVLNGTQLNYTYENYLEQVMLADKLTSSDLGIGCGLISQQWWELCGRVYYVDLSRSQPEDKAASRNLSISFTNNSNVIIDLVVFTVYLDKLIVDVETGIIRKPSL